MSKLSNDVILRFQGFNSLAERKEIGGILASFITGILESADNPKEAAHYCQYFLRERLSAKERKKVAKFVVVYENSPSMKKGKYTQLHENVDLNLSTLLDERKAFWGGGND